jgi:hypothetical protein
MRGHGRHRGVKASGGCGLAPVIVEEWRPELALEAWLTCRNAVPEVGPCASPLLGLDYRSLAHRSDHVGPQQLGGHRQRKHVRVALFEIALAGQQAQHASQGISIRTRSCGQFFDRSWSVT